MSKTKKLKALLAAGAAAFSLVAFNPNALAFQEYNIPYQDDNDSFEDTVNHFKVELVYFQPVPMEPQGMMLSPDQADIHIETDIHATEGNECGFGVGEWIPYMRVEYKFTKRGSSEPPIEGTFMPMSADDGPHYGANVKMQGTGIYDCEFKFYPPQSYALHTDEDTGVPGHLWTEPVTAKWTFNYVKRNW